MTPLPATPLNSPGTNVGFNMAPSFFRVNASLIEAGPAKIAESRAAEIRLKSFNDAVRFHREAIDALFRLKAMDATGQLVAGKLHYEVHVNRSEDAAENMLDAADDFVKAWKL